LVTDAHGAEHHSIVDEVIEELVRQIARHKADVRKEHLRCRRQRQLVDQHIAMPFLQADFENHRTPAFFILLKPLLNSVRDHAQRELKILELEDTIPIGEVTADDLVDDVLVAAWEAFDERPRHTPLDVWLMGILHERLNELQQQFSDVRLSIPVEHASAEELDTDIDDLNFWLSQGLEPAAEATLEDVIQDEASDDWWRKLETKDQHEQLMRFLQRLPKHERQAFMLSEVEGFESSEIGFALDRSEKDIAKDVERARSELRAMIEAEATIPSTTIP
jgi:RNA polymerase sigma factor (sigma-70 family)